MAEPKQRQSVVRSKNRRRNQIRLASREQVSLCAQCKQPVAKHRIHRHCVDAHVKLAA